MSNLLKCVVLFIMYMTNMVNSKRFYYNAYLEDEEVVEVVPKYKRIVPDDPNYQYYNYYGKPPPPSEAAKMARYVMHSVDWGALATTSTQARIKSYPFANVFSICDGPISNGTGIPYLYLTGLDLSVRDLDQNYRSSLVVTLAETMYCAEHGWDPEDPNCAKLVLTGKIKKLKLGSPELQFARDSLFSRHPVMRTWPKDHNFYLAKMKIEQVSLLDVYGGAKFIHVKDYLSVPNLTSRQYKENDYRLKV